MKEWKFKGHDSTLLEALTERAKLPQKTILRLLECGAVVRKINGKGAWTRTRNPLQKLQPSDEIHLSYEPRVINLPTFESNGPIWSCNHYGVWFKPAGIMSQGTAAGDHCSLLYAVEKKGHTPYLVHRLDRETEGVMLVAYSAMAAGKLSIMFQNHEIQKTYQAIIVKASVLENQSGTFNDSLDGKKAETPFRIIKRLEDDMALIELKPTTGRLHQIRRHLALNGSGVWGDPKYGEHNKNRDGMKLAATGLDFIDPWKRCQRSFSELASFAVART